MGTLGVQAACNFIATPPRTLEGSLSRFACAVEQQLIVRTITGIGASTEIEPNSLEAVQASSSSAAKCASRSKRPFTSSAVLSVRDDKAHLQRTLFSQLSANRDDTRNYVNRIWTGSKPRKVLVAISKASAHEGVFSE